MVDDVIHHFREEIWTQCDDRCPEACLSSKMGREHTKIKNGEGGKASLLHASRCESVRSRGGE